MSVQTPTPEQQEQPEKPTPSADELMRRQEELREQVEQHLAELHGETSK